jgi:hypothetical protein
MRTRSRKKIWLKISKSPPSSQPFTYESLLGVIFRNRGFRVESEYNDLAKGRGVTTPELKRKNG